MTLLERWAAGPAAETGGRPGILRCAVLRCSTSRLGYALAWTAPDRGVNIRLRIQIQQRDRHDRPVRTASDRHQRPAAERHLGPAGQPAFPVRSLARRPAGSPRRRQRARSQPTRSRGNATEIDGNATNTGTREQTESATGQPLFVDKLGNTENVEITRERTAEDDGSGQYAVLADQLVFKTGNGDDKVKVTQGENGNLSFDVNGEQYDVKLAQGQQLTVRTGDGNDTSTSIRR